MQNTIRVTRFDSESAFGYTQITTFFEDFGIAEHFGEKAVRDTYIRAFKAWKNDYKYLTELVMVLNWKIWEHYQTNENLARVYGELWEVADMYASENLKGEELAYFLSTTD